MILNNIPVQRLMYMHGYSVVSGEDWIDDGVYLIDIRPKAG